MKLFKTIVGCLLLSIFHIACEVNSVAELERNFDPSPCPDIPSIIYGEHEYPTIQIGNQCWFQENLNIGTQINGSEEAINNETIEKYCYKNEPNNCEVLGGLYDWNEMMQYNNDEHSQGICPEGWHIPSEKDWQTLIDFTETDWKKLFYPESYVIDDNEFTYNGDFEDSDYNHTGFSIYTTGIKFPNSHEFSSTQSYDLIWSSTLTSLNEAKSIEYGQFLPSKDKSYAFPVRCIKD